MRLLIALVLIPASLIADNWPGYRGPTGMGEIESDQPLPLTWSPETAFWKVPLPIDGGEPDHNQSSPIIHGDRIFVTTSVWPAGAEKSKSQPAHRVSCYRLTDGKQLWSQPVDPGPWILTDLRGGYTVPTPATDGERVFAAFGSSILHALDFDGEVVWSRQIPDHDQFDVAMASSPIVYDGKVILLTDRKPPKSTIQAFDGATGQIVWTRERPETSFGHVTPVLFNQQLLVSATDALQGLDPADGEEIWSCKWGRGIWPVASPVAAKNLVYCMGGRGGHPGLIVDPAGKGEVAPKFSLGPAAEGLGSPVAFGDLVFRLNSPGILRCVRITTGEQLFEERLEGADPSISPVVTGDGRIYIASAGKTVVVRASEKLEVLGESDLGDRSQASAAVSDGRIILKGRDYLWCVGQGG